MDKETKRQIDTEKKRVGAYKKQVRKTLDTEETLQVRFTNLESKGVPLEFNFQGVRNYKLFDGGTYDLPVTIINHINSLSVPHYKQYDPAEEKNSLRAEPARVDERIDRMEPRFSLVPVDAFDLTKRRKPKADKAA